MLREVGEGEEEQALAIVLEHHVVGVLVWVFAGGCGLCLYTVLWRWFIVRLGTEGIHLVKSMGDVVVESTGEAGLFGQDRGLDLGLAQFDHALC